MPKTVPYETAEYEEVLTKVLEAANQVSYLWRERLVDSKGLHLFRFNICEQDNDYEDYGIVSDEGVLRYSHSGRGIERSDVEVPRFAKKLADFDRRNNTLPPSEVVDNFLKNLEKPLRDYEIKKANIDGRVENKINALEASLRAKPKS